MEDLDHYQYQLDIQNYEKQINGMEGGVITRKNLEKQANALEKDQGAGDAIPREPEKLKLKGHRSKVTKIAFHPIYT